VSGNIKGLKHWRPVFVFQFSLTCVSRERKSDFQYRIVRARSWLLKRWEMFRQNISHRFNSGVA